MKLFRLSAITLMLATLFFSGCKSKSAKELIVNKWKFTDVTGTDAAQIPDSVKTKMFATATMEFKKDGSYEQSGGMREDVEKGTYILSDDGKTMISKANGSGMSDTVMILELSKTKMVVSPKTKGQGQNITLTLMPK